LEVDTMLLEVIMFQFPPKHREYH